MIIFLIFGTILLNLGLLRLQVRRRRQVIAATREMDRASLVLIETAQKAIEATGTQMDVPSEEEDDVNLTVESNTATAARIGRKTRRRVGLTSEG
ncbi:MAG: hypothetical protein QOI08_703 [Actinomycetota bacterium]|nr:hypothetical protein [Actinomycetota bacterium]